MEISNKFFDTKQYKEVKIEFDKYYIQKILPELEKQEITRKKYLKVFIFISLFVGIWVVYTCKYLLLNSFFNSGENNAMGLLGCLLVLLVCSPMFCFYITSKKSILPLIVNFFGEFDYEYQKNIPSALLKKSLLFNDYNTFKADDSFAGTYKDTYIEITEYKQYKYVTNSSAQNQQARKTEISKGLIFYAYMNKKFSGQTLVLRDRGIFNHLVSCHKNNDTKLNRVSLEATKFEKAYEVYSDNQIEARYILTTVMLEYLMELKEKFSLVQLSFFDNHVLIDIKTTKNLFECNSFFRSIINQKRIEKNFKELYLLFSIIETLRLNQKRIL